MSQQKLTISTKQRDSIIRKLSFVYGSEAEELYLDIVQLLENFLQQNPKSPDQMKTKRSKVSKFSHKDFIFNSYADSIISELSTPLEALRKFGDKFISKTINGVHILPFYPWDTDRGFSVLNYNEVDSRNGSWQDIISLTKSFENLMIDVVINHASIDNKIVQQALLKQDYQNFVITFDDENKPSKDELLKITRARPSPVLTRYTILKDENGNSKAYLVNSEENGEGWVWTTFSRPNTADGKVNTRQVDLNFENPRVFIEFLMIILNYISYGATWIRLDAIGYLWKELGTNCLHRPQTHEITKLYSEILALLDHLSIVLIAEVNEPQEKALQYLGSEKESESDMIYLFTHFPLAVHAVLSGTAKFYMNWLPSLIPANGKYFVTVLGTHDGMGQKPVGNWLPKSEKEFLQNMLVKQHGALPNHAYLSGGEKIIYELCGTPWSFIIPKDSNLGEEISIRRYTAVFTLGLMIKGVPSIYINGLLGIPNSEASLDEYRTINRQRLKENELFEILSDPSKLNHKILTKILRIIEIRQKEEAFELTGGFLPVQLHDSIVSVLLSSNDEKNNLLATVNVSNSVVHLTLDLDNYGWNRQLPEIHLVDLFSDEILKIDSIKETLTVTFEPYQVRWIRERFEGENQ
ncbi:MAG: alpha-amylase family glycosyl hydrolase [Candidatus Hodarchaeales archaeon]|jgi:sucrose phosphorylase